MLYKTAKQWATDICDQLRPLCERIEIAGSIRRRQGLCSDIDLVCQASDSQRLRVRARCLRSSPQVRSDGTQIMSLVLHNNIQVQVFFARPTVTDLFETVPTNWGSIMLCRTGPREFNQAIALRAAELGLHWNPFAGIMRGDQIIASATERDIFHAVKWRYIEPEQRKHIHLQEIAA